MLQWHMDVCKAHKIVSNSTHFAAFINSNSVSFFFTITGTTGDKDYVKATTHKSLTM